MWLLTWAYSRSSYNLFCFDADTPYCIFHDMGICYGLYSIPSHPALMIIIYWHKRYYRIYRSYFSLFPGLLSRPGLFNICVISAIFFLLAALLRSCRVFSCATLRRVITVTCISCFVFDISWNFKDGNATQQPPPTSACLPLYYTVQKKKVLCNNASITFPTWYFIHIKHQ